MPSRSSLSVYRCVSQVVSCVLFSRVVCYLYRVLSLLEVFSNNSSPHAFIPRVGIAVALLQTVDARATVGRRRIVVEPRDENAREDLQARVRHGHLTLAMCRLPNGAREGARVYKLAMRVEPRPQTHLREFCKARAREQ